MTKKGFTLSEVLITLGIIGVVVALTMPSIIANYQKEKTVSYVKKFYNEINNAVRMAVVDNGDVELWMPEAKQNTYSQNLEFLSEYLLPYINYLKYENCNDKKVCVYLTYGMFSFRVDENGGDIVFFINSKYERYPKNYFAFQFNKNNTNNKAFVEPYYYRWNGNENSLNSTVWGGCNKNAPEDAKYAYCTKWIQMNNWKIPDNYPWNVRK